MCFSIHFFIFSLKKIGYILKIHKFAPSRTHLVYEYFKNEMQSLLKKVKERFEKR